MKPFEELTHLITPHATQLANHLSPPTTPASTTENDHPLLENIGFEPTSIDALVDRSGLTPEAVSSMLLTLELQGIVASSGGLFCRVR